MDRDSLLIDLLSSTVKPDYAIQRNNKKGIAVSFRCLQTLCFLWRRHPDSNRGIAVLQTAALPLGYAAKNWSGKRDLNPRLRPWQGRTLPLSYSRFEIRILIVTF